jgi:hypothetical protein
MFGFGKRGKVKRAADKFVEAIALGAENSFRDFLQIILQSLMDDDVRPERVEEIVNTAPPSLVFFSALFSYEVVKSKFAFDDETASLITEESLNALKRNMQEPTGEAVHSSVLMILENINFANSMTPIGEERALALVGWNALKFFNFDANPEIKQLMDNSGCTEKLTRFLDDACRSWWKTAEKIGSI